MPEKVIVKSGTEDPKANAWLDEIKHGEEYRKKYGHSENWKDWKDAYRGNWDQDKVVPVNKIFSYMRSLIPRTYFRTPSVVVTPRLPMRAWQAKTFEAIDTYLLEETNLKYELKRTVLDAGYAGTGPIKLGFDSEFGFIPGQVIDNSETASQYSSADGTKIEWRSNIKKGMPWAISQEPDTVIVPWGYRDPQNLPWVAHMFIRDVQDVREDQKYNTNKTHITGGYEKDKNIEKYNDLFTRDADRQYVRLYEIRDKRTKKIIVICQGYVLMEEDDVLQIEGLSWEFYIPNPDPEFFWGISDVAMVMAQQLEYNEIRTQASRHRKMALLKFLYKKGSIDQVQLDKILSEEFMPGIAVDDDNIRGTVEFIQAHVPPDLYTEALAVDRDFRDSLGFGSNQAGEFSGRSTPPTATEASIVQQGSEIRSDERRDIMADMLVSILKKWNDYVAKFWTSERVMKIVGPDGGQHWVSFKGSDLVGDYNLKVDPDSGLPINRQTRMAVAEKAFLMFNGDPYTNQLLLRQRVADSFSGIDPLFEMLAKPDQNPNPPTEEMTMGMMGRLGGGQGGPAGPGSKPSLSVKGSAADNPQPLNKAGQ